jgi:5'-nucleotidase
MTETIPLTILHSNDMHGHLDEMARLSTFVRQQRAALEAAGRQVLYVDCGDAADRSQRFCGVTKGSVFPPILAAMGVQMQALGNDISVTYGPQAAAQMAQNSPFPVLAANFYRDGQPLLPGFERWQIWQVSQAVSVGVIGLTVNTLGFYRLFGLDVPDFTSTTRETFAELSQQIHGPVIVLSHLGLQDDLELARTMPELAVIIGGHSHTLLEQGQWEGSVLVAQAGEYAAQLGRVDLTLDANSGDVLARSATILPVPADTMPDPDVLAAVNGAIAAADEIMRQPLGELRQTLAVNYFGDCPLGNLAADALRSRMQADVALVSSGLFHKPLEAGPLTLEMLDSACFTTANPQLSKLSGAELLAALETGLDETYSARLVRAFRGTPIGFPAVSGMVVKYDPLAQPRVQSVLIHGQPLLPDKTYTLAHTDAEVSSPNFPAGYFPLRDEQVVRVEVPTILREAIADYIQTCQPACAPDGPRLIQVSGD